MSEKPSEPTTREEALSRADDWANGALSHWNDFNEKAQASLGNHSSAWRDARIADLLQANRYTTLAGMLAPAAELEERIGLRRTPCTCVVDGRKQDCARHGPTDTPGRSVDEEPLSDTRADLHVEDRREAEHMKARVRIEVLLEEALQVAETWGGQVAEILRDLQVSRGEAHPEMTPSQVELLDQLAVALGRLCTESLLLSANELDLAAVSRALDAYEREVGRENVPREVEIGLGNLQR